MNILLQKNLHIEMLEINDILQYNYKHVDINRIFKYYYRKQPYDCVT